MHDWKRPVLLPCSEADVNIPSKFWPKSVAENSSLGGKLFSCWGVHMCPPKMFHGNLFKKKEKKEKKLSSMIRKSYFLLLSTLSFSFIFSTHSTRLVIMHSHYFFENWLTNHPTLFFLTINHRDYLLVLPAPKKGIDKGADKLLMRAQWKIYCPYT